MKEHFIQFLAISFGALIAKLAIAYFSGKVMVVSEIFVGALVIGFVAAVLRALVYHFAGLAPLEGEKEEVNKKS